MGQAVNSQVGGGDGGVWGPRALSVHPGVCTPVCLASERNACSGSSDDLALGPASPEATAVSASLLQAQPVSRAGSSQTTEGTRLCLTEAAVTLWSSTPVCREQSSMGGLCTGQS